MAITKKNAVVHQLSSTNGSIEACAHALAQTAEVVQSGVTSGTEVKSDESPPEGDSDGLFLLPSKRNTVCVLEPPEIFLMPPESGGGICGN